MARRPESIDPKAPILALDTASPLVSIAVGDADAILAQRSLDLRGSAEAVLGVVDEVLADAGLHLDQLRGVAVIRGPGSFTGLRVGLATALGWHQALGLPATGLDGHAVLALAAARRWGSAAEGREVTAAADALRDEWSVRSYRIGSGGRPEPIGDRQRVTARTLVTSACAVIGFGVEALADLAASGQDDIELLPASPLAPVALAAADQEPWDAGLLLQPIYFRPPAVTRSKKDAPPPPAESTTAIPSA